MKTSPSGMQLIKHFEGCKLRSYLCPANILTIGYGHTGTDVKENQVITQQEADRLLFDDLVKFENQLNQLNLPLKQYQFDALVSFCFNLGFGSLLKSTLLKKIKAGDFEAAALEFLKWDKAGGKQLAGLTKRRQAESNLFKGMSIEQSLEGA